MPVRTEAVSVALRELLRDQSYSFMNDPSNPTANLNGVQMPRDEFDERFLNPIVRIFEHVVDSINWNRVMIEAESRHIALEGRESHERCAKFAEDHGHGFGPECLCEALLADDTVTDWEENPRSPRYHK